MNQGAQYFSYVKLRDFPRLFEGNETAHELFHVFSFPEQLSEKNCLKAYSCTNVLHSREKLDARAENFGS